VTAPWAISSAGSSTSPDGLRVKIDELAPELFT